MSFAPLVVPDVLAKYLGFPGQRMFSSPFLTLLSWITYISPTALLTPISMSLYHTMFRTNIRRKKRFVFFIIPAIFTDRVNVVPVVKEAVKTFDGDVGEEQNSEDCVEDKKYHLYQSGNGT